MVSLSLYVGGECCGISHALSSWEGVPVVAWWDEFVVRISMSHEMDHVSWPCPLFASQGTYWHVHGVECIRFVFAFTSPTRHLLV
mmetsp:Transcript_4404/g.28100  ORF Transcript_4404/g.28100 Transcript_4404/m.28100 type:complete len:85 (+) Transcript_4404:1189-1443(+)